MFWHPGPKSHFLTSSTMGMYVWKVWCKTKGVQIKKDFQVFLASWMQSRNCMNVVFRFSFRHFKVYNSTNAFSFFSAYQNTSVSSPFSRKGSDRLSGGWEEMVGGREGGEEQSMQMEKNMIVYTDVINCPSNLEYPFVPSHVIEWQHSLTFMRIS